MMSTNLARNSMNFSDEYLHVLCDPCRFNGKTTVAMKYCRDCNGHLCPNCVNLHMKGSNTKNHVVSYIITKRAGNVVHNTSSGTAQLAKHFETRCIEHSKPVVSYCLVHDSLCCRICIGTSHRECQLQVLSEAASGSRDSRELRKVESGIKQLQTKFEEIHREKQGNLQHLGLQNDTFTTAVRTYRKTLNNILDKLETGLLKRKDRLYDTKVEEIRGCLKACQTAIGVLNGSLHKIDIAARQGDDQFLFLTMKKVQAVTRRYEKVYTDQEKLPKNYNFHFQPDISIEKFLKGIAEMGKIKDDSGVTNGPVGSWKANNRGSGRDGARQQQGQQNDSASTPSDTSTGRMKSPRKQNLTSPAHTASPKSPEDLNVRLLSDKKNCSITGTAFLPDDKIVVADATNKKIKLFNADLKPISNLEMPSAPRDVTTISTSEIACTLPNEKVVHIISVGRDMNIKKSIKLEVECYGVTCYENELFVTSGWSTEKEVQVINFEGVVQRKLRPKAGVMKCPLYVTVDAKMSHVYVSDYENGVIGMDMDGSVIYRYNDTVTKGYMGICSSPGGTVYICTLQPNGISKVRTENKLVASLPSLNENDLEPLISLPNKGGQRPRSIAYSKKSNKLLISFVGQSVDVLSIYHL